MKYTFDKIISFNEVANKITDKFGEDPKNKFLYAIVKNQKKVSKIIQDYTKWQQDYHFDKSNDYKIELASVDSNGDLIQDDAGKFSYTKENMKKLTKQLKKLENELIDRLDDYKEKEFEVEPYFYKEEEESVILKALYDDEREALVGFVLDPVKENA